MCSGPRACNWKLLAGMSKMFQNCTGKYKSWTVDSGLDCGLDCGLDPGLDCGLDYGLDCGLDYGLDSRLS